jgi:NitT/TauT family transport system substrate-binding protein
LAAERGAQISLVSVTAWKKFYFVSGKLPLKEGEEPSWPESLSELSSYLEKNGLERAAAPRSGPALGIAERLAALGGPSFKIAGLPPQQAVLELASGKRPAALLPEPIATLALSKNPNLKAIASLEEEYARRAGGRPRLPQAGVAASRAFYEKNKAKVHELAFLMKKSEEAFASMGPERAVSFLPEATLDALGRDVVEASFERDPVMVESAWDARGEITAFLCAAAPELCRGGALVPELSGFIPNPEGAGEENLGGAPGERKAP